MKAMKISQILVILLSLCLVALFFLPLVSMKGEYRQKYAEGIKETGMESYRLYGDEVAVEAKDLLDLSFFDYARIFFLTSTEDEVPFSILGIYIVAMGVFAILCLFWSLLRKPVLILISDLIAGGLYFQLMKDTNPNRFSYSSSTGYGIAYYLYYPVIIAIGILAIVLFIAKHNYKKRMKEAYRAQAEA